MGTPHTHFARPARMRRAREAPRTARERGLLGDPKQPPHTQSAAQQAAHALTAVLQSWGCGGQWHMVRIHLASARACGNRSTCAAEGACCEWHGRCVCRGGSGCAGLWRCAGGLQWSPCCSSSWAGTGNNGSGGRARVLWRGFWRQIPATDPCSERHALRLRSAPAAPAPGAPPQ